MPLAGLASKNTLSFSRRFCTGLCTALPAPLEGRRTSIHPHGDRDMLLAPLPPLACPPRPIASNCKQDLRLVLSSPAHLLAKNTSAFLYFQPSFIAFIVISSEDYLISSECQQHTDLMLKLNNSLNNALGRYFSQSVIFRYLGERSALCYHTGNRKRKSKNVFSTDFKSRSI